MLVSQICWLTNELILAQTVWFVATHFMSSHFINDMKSANCFDILINISNYIYFYFIFSYLLGLLAKIKCSISSSQPDLWDCKQLAYNWRLGNFMKPYCHEDQFCLQLLILLLGQNVTSVLQYLWVLRVSIYIYIGTPVDLKP